MPAGTQNGDLMLAYIATQTGNGAWITAPAGWTQATKTFNSIQGAQLFWRVADNEPSSYTWNDASYPEGVIRTYRNAGPLAPIGGYSGCGSYGASCQIPAFTETSIAGERYVGFWDFNLAADAITAPGDFGNVSRSLAQRSLLSGDKAVTTTGSETLPAETAMVTGASNYWDAIGVTVKPVSTTKTTTPPSVACAKCGDGTAVVHPDPNHPQIAVSSNDFLNTLGVIGGCDTAITQTPSLYTNLGVRFIRGVGALSDANCAINLAKATNTKITWSLFTFNENFHPFSEMIAGAETLAKAGVLLAVEGANEPNNFGGVVYQGQVGGGNGDWMPVAKLQRDLYAAVKADSILKNYPVWNISHTGAETNNVGLQFLKIPTGAGTLMPDGTAFADYANVHNYAIWDGATAPVDNIAWYSAAPTGHVPPAQEVFSTDYGVTWAYNYQGYTDAQLPTVPRVTTETGWWQGSGGADAEGKTLLNVYLSQYMRGWEKTFIYSITDRTPEQFGIYQSNGTPKLAANYIHNMTTILADTQELRAPGTMNWSIPGQPATVHAFLLQKGNGGGGNGHFWLVIWDERWPAQTDNIVVSLGATYNNVNKYDPTVGTAVQASFNKISTLSLTMTDHPIFLEVY
ncbi:MAG: hypothetical protein ACLPSF_14685 [Methylocella sp.]